ncbi:MAG: hypothetical protein Q8O56_04900 [Solirubrobacteraceae bacterium]|nr:hypothetical protein [Solirubrobacteraceae bacterium]
MLILIVGVLGTLTLIEGSMASTSATTAREQGTNLARDLVERSRQAAYEDMTMAAAPTTLRGMLPASDNASAVTGAPPTSTFEVTRRNVVYKVTVFACSIDDPTDGAGQGDATFCETPTVTPTPGDPPPGPAASVNVLGIAVNLAGSLLDTVCNAVGTNTQILNTLTSLVSNVAPISVCASTTSGTVAFDAHPDDLRRVRIDVSWTRGGSGSVSQTTLLTNPRQT